MTNDPTSMTSTVLYEADDKSAVICQDSCCDDPDCNEDQENECMEYVVGDCIPDGEGGCQRSRGRESACCGPASKSGQDTCCGDTPETAHTDCGLELDPVCKDNCCESVIEVENSCADAVPKSCCSDCQKPTSEPELDSDAQYLPTLPLGNDSSGDECCGGHSVPHSGVRRRVPFYDGDAGQSYSHQGEKHEHKPSNRHKHTHKHSHRHGASRCSTETAFGRFFKVACCCLIDWANTSKAHRHSKKNTEDHSNDHIHVERRQIGKKGAVPTQARDSSMAESGGGRSLTMVMSIEGMDCPSCASKVTRALLTLPSVRDVKVNSFAGQASLAYTEGLVFPARIAKRTEELTGFACGVLEEVRPQGEYSVMRVRVPLTMDVAWEKVDLPSAITVKSFKRSIMDIVLDVEYNASNIQPRTVLAAFSPCEGSFVPKPKVRLGDQAGKELTTLLQRTTISAIFCIPILVLSWAPLPDHPIAYGGVSLALATVIQAYVAAPLYSAALRSLFLQHILDMDLLVVLSSTIAYLFSAVAYFLLVAGHPFSEPFFETSTLLITLITLGRLISAYARRRATSALDDVRSLQADTVELLGKGGSTTTISSELMHMDDTLLIAPDTLVPTDGTVSFGSSHVDESSITGESLPVEKLIGSQLTAGTLNGSGVLHMKVERMPSDNTISDIGKLMLDVQDARLPVQDLADKVASYLAPVILVVSLVTFCIWMAVGMTVRNQNSNTAGIAALRYAISVMVISCPCALVLCVPMVVVIATGVAGKTGVLFKSAQAVQYAKDVKVAIFDKTGTLTTGTLEVVESHVPANESIAAVLGLVSASHHPVAQAVFKHLSALYPSISPNQFKDVQSIPGQGMEARDGGQVIRGGNPTWLNLGAHPVISKMQDQALTMFAVTSNASLVAAFGLSDAVRPSAHSAVQYLTAQGCEVYIVSGDAQPVVSALATQIGVPPSHAFGGCLPQTKLERVRALQGSPNNKKTKTKVMFVGDGTNDSLALAQADVGVSLGSGTDIALSAADIVVLTSSSSASSSVDLTRALSTIFAISRGAVLRIRVNFAWSFLYNALAVLLAAGAFVKVRIAPEYAGLGEMVSVVPVVGVAWSMWLLRR